MAVCSLRRARVEFEQEKWSDAMSTLEKAMQARPGDPDLLGLYADCARFLGRTDEASKAYEAALKRIPNHARSLVGLLWLAVGARDMDEANRAYEAMTRQKVRTRDAQRAEAQLLAMTSKGSVGRVRVRKATYTRWGARDPLLWTSLGQLQYQAEEFGRAARSFGKAAAFDSSNPEPIARRILAQLRLGLVKPAERSMKLAEKVERQNRPRSRVRALLRVARGRLAFENDQIAMARRLAQRALSNDPRCAEAHLLLADIAENRNDSPHEHLRRAAGCPDAPPIAFARLALSEPSKSTSCDWAKRYKTASPSGRFVSALAPLGC